ncbi:MAG: alkaline phosphatase family protein, partial [Actinomycetota bacterium]|nr:alkaline phosphatase family protein [Actinomycetota bacterium]
MSDLRDPLEAERLVTEAPEAFRTRGDILQRTAATAATAGAAHGPGRRTRGARPGHRLRGASIRHVFIIVLENESASTTFAPGSPAPYLATTLRSQGAYVPNYYGVGHNSNDNYIAMISGQAPNVQTQADCQNFTDMLPGTIGAGGQALGTGCVYPTTVPTIASQLETAGFTWRSYNEDMGAAPARETSVCAHPAINATDNTQTATATDEYATRHNPFVYFHGIIDDTSLCNTHVVGLHALTQDLTAPPPAAPNYSFITPGLCNAGHDAPCKNGQPGGLVSADRFLQTWVPRITASPAYRQDGLLMVLFDEAGGQEPSSCCGEIPGPGSPMPGITGPGGGPTGAVLLSPCIAPGTVTRTAYNHYSMLASVEDSFGLSHIG